MGGCGAIVKKQYTALCSVLLYIVVISAFKRGSKIKEGV